MKEVNEIKKLAALPEEVLQGAEYPVELAFDQPKFNTLVDYHSALCERLNTVIAEGARLLKAKADWQWFAEQIFPFITNTAGRESVLQKLKLLYIAGHKITISVQGATLTNEGNRRLLLETVAFPEELATMADTIAGIYAVRNSFEVDFTAMWNAENKRFEVGETTKAAIREHATLYARTPEDLRLYVAAHLLPFVAQAFEQRKIRLYDDNPLLATAARDPLAMVRPGATRSRVTDVHIDEARSNGQLYFSATVNGTRRSYRFALPKLNIDGVVYTARQIVEDEALLTQLIDSRSDGLTTEKVELPAMS